MTKFHVISIFQIDSPLNLESARATCSSFGSNWNVTRTTEGSIVCSNVPWHRNCETCDSWRLLVWIDGACEIGKYDPYSKCKTSGKTTKAGQFYCGYNPCKGGDLTHGGTWAVSV